MLEGTLTIMKNGALYLAYVTPRGMQNSEKVKDAELSLPLLEQKKTAIAKLEGLEVELELVNGQPTKIREKGKAFESTHIVATPTANPGHISPSSPTRAGNFHNPYNFIPSPPRKTDDPELGDHAPVGHGRYHQDYWSGRIAVKLTTVTPLLIPDAANATEENNHKTYPIRMTKDGKPNLPPTSVKGMLRSAYESITNSRFGIFEEHSDRLAYRMPPSIGLQMVPARIENNQICLYPGTSAISSDGKPVQGNPMYAAWLPRYRRDSTRVIQNSNFSHGQKVTVWLEKFNKTKRDGRTIFSYWKVITIVPFGQNIQEPSNHSNSYGSHQATGDRKKVNGFVGINKKNIDNKHDERVFFTTQSPIKIDLTSELKTKWTKLIKNYQEIHEIEIQRGTECPPALNNSQWSRHVTGGEAEQNLIEGTLCYAHVQKQGDRYEVLGLYPVMISRGLYKFSPEQLLPDTLKPARSKDELSPSDRVFGWVKQEGSGSYKGNLKIYNVSCSTENAIEEFGEEGFPLTILGQPKPEQARFYQAQDKQGTPIPNKSDKEKNYSDQSQGLRGRKVYPHHQGLPDNYWNNPQEDRTQQAINGFYQEYRRCGGETDEQNRSIKAWVKPEVEFKFTIDIINLSSVELGALLWLLSLPPNHYHRLGGAKPLGFGSVRLEIDWANTDLRKGQKWQEYYRSLFPINAPHPQEAQSSIDSYQTAIAQAYGNGNNFNQVSFIAAFCRNAQGFDDRLPLHYPRTEAKPNPDGEGFDWFTQNERTGNDGGLKLSLPSLVSDRGLPFNPQ